MTRRRLTPWMMGVGGVTFLAGLLFGYDQGVVPQERWVKHGDRMLDERDLHLPPAGPGDAVPG